MYHILLCVFIAISAYSKAACYDQRHPILLLYVITCGITCTDRYLESEDYACVATVVQVATWRNSLLEVYRLSSIAREKSITGAELSNQSEWFQPSKSILYWTTVFSIMTHYNFSIVLFYLYVAITPSSLGISQH